MTALPALASHYGTAPAGIPQEAARGRPGPKRRVFVPPGRYGDTRLTVIREVASVSDPGGRRRAVLCQCDCGTEVTVRLDNLPRTHSCGCWRKEVTATLNRRSRDRAAGP